MHALIINERSRRSMTQKRLAHEAGIDPRTLRKIEKGEVVSPESLHAVYRVLGIAPETVRQRAEGRELSTGDADDSPTSDVSRADVLKFLRMAIIVFAVSGLLAAVTIQVFPNAQITIDSPTLCADVPPQKVVEAAQAALPDLALTFDHAVRATDGCKVDVTLRVPNAGPTNDAMVATLKSHGIRATVVRHRRPFF